jgi:DNA ligase D-like protein (predicted ligase)
MVSMATIKSKRRPRKAKAPLPTVTAHFVEPMECLGATQLPEGPGWSYEIKLDGFRLEAVKSAGAVFLFSRRQNILNLKFPHIVAALQALPDNTILDGEVVAIDPAGRSDFNLLQKFRSGSTRIHYYAFDILMLRGKSLMQLPLAKRRKILQSALPPHNHLSLSAVDIGSSAHIMRFVETSGLEGLVAKHIDSVYEPGKRSGLWTKHRINQGQEFVVGGYTPGSNGFDALIVGFYRGKDLIFTARVKGGFVPGSRRSVFARIKGLKQDICPFANLPELAAGKWGQGLTAAKMKGCVWVKPQVVVRVDFLEWTAGDKLRHPTYVAMREDKVARRVVREGN